MTLNEQKQQLSIAYVRAVAAAAGCKVTREEVDDDSVDVTLGRSGPHGTVRSPRIEVQLKCTAGPTWEEDGLRFRLPLKNYDDLRADGYMIPRILVVLVVPGSATDWLVHSTDYLGIRHCGYWLSLLGMEAYTGGSSDTKVAVKLPQHQQFTTANLLAMFHRIGAGGRL